MPVDLYYSAHSANSNAIIMLAKSLGVELNLIPIDNSKGENLTPAFLKLNPQHTIPTIADGEFSLWETRAILTYLVEKYATDDSLYPKDAQRRAVINQRLYFDLGTLYQRFSDYAYPQFRGAPADPEKWTKALESVAFLNTFLDGHSHVAGDALSVADYALAPTVSLYVLLGLDVAEYPNVQRWYAAVQKELVGWEAFEENLKLLAAMVEQIKQKQAAAE